MSKRPHGKAPVSDEGLASASDRERTRIHSHGGKHVHLTNSIHIRRHLHLQSHEVGGGLMLDARRASSLQLPLLQREVTALHKIRTLQDPGTSSSITSGASSTGNKSRRIPSTFIGDPHRDAQALAFELSGKLAKSAKVTDGGSSRVPRRGLEKPKSVTKVEKKKKSKKMTAEDIPPPPGNGMEVSMNVRERIKRIEEAFDGSSTNTLSGELRKEGLIKELKARGGASAENKNVDGISRSDERWEEGPARREDVARRVIEERGSSISSLSQLLGTHYGSGRSALMAAMVDEDDRRSNLGESLFETDEDELSPMEREMTQQRVVAPMSPASPLHLASLSRPGKQELRKPNTRARKSKPRRTAERTAVNIARPRGGKSNKHSQQLPPPPAIVDDGLDVSELPARNGSGPQWDWSRIRTVDGKSFLDVTGLTSAQLPEAARQHGLEALLTEQNLDPVQSISSLDSDANALPLIIGEDAHDSDLAGYYNERSREVPQKLARRKASLQNAVKDVPAQEASSSKEIHPEGHRTLTQKYRPKKFREIVGQPVVVKSLSTAIVKGKVAPVYLFMGPRGTGKTSAARVFAAGLNCESLDFSGRPCGICRECGTMALNRSPAVKQIDAASAADLASMRAMIMESLASEIFTSHARYRVFIVEGCDLLSTETWNAFLKVLEEPPRNVVFILITTNPEQIPATAASRCQKFLFLKLKEVDIVRRLQLLAIKEDLLVEDGAFELIAARSDGSLRDAEIVLDQLCLLDRNVSVALVRELVGLPSDTRIMDLLDYALSADTVNTVRTMREVLASGVESLSLVSQLGALITDILVGSRDVNREIRPSLGFFNRNISVKEQQLRLRQALKILSEVEKQLRVTTDRATWLTAALLQFAPDRSFLPSEANTSAEPSPDVVPPQSTAAVASAASLPRSGRPSMDEPEYQTQIPEPSELGLTLQGYEDSSQEHPLEVPIETASSEQKLEEAWSRELPQQQQQQQQQQQLHQQELEQEEQQVSVEEDDGTADAEHPPEVFLEFQVFRDEALPELWRRVLREITSRSLKHLLLTHGRLIAAGVAVDGSCAVVELEFEYARDKRRAERSWRSICIAFQEVLRTAVELRITFRDVPADQQAAEAAARTEEPTVLPGSSAPLKSGEILTDEDFATRLGQSTSQSKHKEIVTEEDAYVHEMQEVPRNHRSRRGAKPRKHRKAVEASEGEPRGGSGGITPRRLPPSRRRKHSRAAESASPQPTKTVIPVREIRRASQESSSFGNGELWESGPLLIPAVVDRPGPSSEKKSLSTMMEDPLSEIDDIRSARKKIWEQRSFQSRSDGSMPAAALNRKFSTVDAQRGIPREVRLCWNKASPHPDFLMRKTRVKGLRRQQGKALFLRFVPCSASRITSNATPVPQGVPPPDPTVMTSESRAT